MEKENITDNLEKLLMAIHRQVVAIRDADEHVPKIEMDKTLSNIRALYEQFTVLNYLNTYPPLKNSGAQPSVMKEEIHPAKAKEPESPFTPIVEKREGIISEQSPKQPITHIQPEFIVPKPEQPVMENQTEKSEPEIKVHPTVEHEIPKHIQPEILKEAHIEPIRPAVQYTSQEEKYMPQPPTVNDSSSKNTTTESQRLGDKLRFQRLDDLHKAVTLSDKFLYMNELFEGENNTYKEAMDLLNRLAQTEAERYMDTLAARYRWADKPKTEKKFRELVSRKFV
jgi:hypothetical protein